MKVTQLYTLINAVTKEVLGETAVVNEDLSNVVDIGKAVIDQVNGIDNYVRKLVDHIGKVVFVNRAYAGGVPSRSAAMTVRRIVAGDGVERKFAVMSPRIAKIEVVRSAVVRRAKLYFLRDRVGKAVRLKERRIERKAEDIKPKVKKRGRKKTPKPATDATE